MRRRKSNKCGGVSTFLQCVYLLTCLSSFVECDIVWNKPYYLPPSVENNGVDFNKDQSVDTSGIVKVNENLAGVCIAVLNYDGEAKPNCSMPLCPNIEVYKNETNGKWGIYLTVAQDFEASNITSKLATFDIGGNTGNLMMAIQNINDNPPVVEYIGSNKCTVDENAAGNLNCTVKVTDIDGISAISTTVNSEGSEFSLLEVSRGTNEITYIFVVNVPLDYERNTLRSTTVLAEDSFQGISYNGSTLVVVWVNDLPDEEPKWQMLFSSQKIDEKTKWDYQFKAVDGDIAINANISYRLEIAEKENEQYFTIDSDTGLFTVEQIDRDKLQIEMFQMTVIAYETENVTSNNPTDITILLNDINDNVPTIHPNETSIKIPEETAMTLNFTETLSVTDKDLGLNGQFMLELEESKWSSAFLLIPNAGYQTADISISIINASAVDYEDRAWQNIILKVIATEKQDAKHVSSALINIQVTNRNDESPIFDQEIYNVKVLEDVGKGYIVTTVNATDPDDDDSVKYSLTQRVMEIDDTSGVVTVSADNAFDYERQKSVMIQVVASDKVDHLGYAQINITVLDVNDEAPTLYTSDDQLQISEHTEEGVTLPASISATDPDSSSDLKFSIDWDKSYVSKQGRIIRNSSVFYEVLRIEANQVGTSTDREWEATLIVNNQSRLDWEVFDTLYLVITVNDTKTDEKYVKNAVRTVTLPVIILDINDNAPEFTELSINAKRSVEENSTPNKLIGTAIATDKDSEENGQIEYDIKPNGGNYPTRMVVIDNNGEIRTGSANIDCEKFQFLLYDVLASDGNHTTVLTINITVIDVNDEPPIVHEVEPIQVEIPENTPSGFEFKQINATDADVTSPYNTLTFMFNNENSDITQYFAINNETGVVKVSLKENFILDREQQDKHELVFVVRDNFLEGMKVGSLTSNLTTVIVTLIDENDESPTFIQKEKCAIHVNEDVNKGTAFFTGVLAHDADEPGNKNSQFDYHLINIESLNNKTQSQDLFSVDTVNSSNGTIQISVNEPLTDLWGEYNVTLGATDFGDEPNSGNGSYIICVQNVNRHNPNIIYPANGLRLYLNSKQSINSHLVDTSLQPIKDFEATDDDDNDGPNGQVTFDITGDENSMKYFKIQSTGNTGYLQLRDIPSSNDNKFEITIIAKDGGTPQLKSEEAIITVIIVNTDNIPPKFFNNTQTLTFPENKTGCSECTQIITLACDDNNNGLTPEDPFWQQPKYYIRDGNTEGLFELNNTSGELTVKKKLDYEERQNHSLIIETYTYNIDPNPVSESLLNLFIQVEDINDEPPRFEYDNYPGIILTNDKYDKNILPLQATDIDVNDNMTFKILNETMTVSDDSLKGVKDSAFKLVGENVTLAINPSSSFQGYFQFQVEVRDSMNPPDDYHRDTALVQIYVVTPANVMQFSFLNSKDEVDKSKSDVSAIFGTVLQCICGVDSTEKAEDENGKPTDNKTVVNTHFLDLKLKTPIDKSTIIEQINDFNIYTRLNQALRSKNLILVDYTLDNSSNENSIQEYLQTILISVSAVLGIMVVILFVAFFVRTRTLNKRLEKLSTTKFGSRDSGLNRVGIAVPNTNICAVEGSNPVWNEDVNPDYDNMSQGSGDSDLIGIEDSPQFNPNGYSGNNGISNTNYVPDNDMSYERRTSVNPLSNMNGDSGIRRTSLNPLSSSFESLDNIDRVGNNSNFTFRKADSVPVTEL